MDFNQPIYINTASGGTLNLNNIAASDTTTSLGPRSGYRVLSSTLGESSAVGYVDKRAVDDGIDIGDSYLSGRQIVLIVGVFGSTKEDFHSRIQELSDVMRVNPRYYDSSYGFRNLTFSQPTIDVSTYSTGLAPLRAIVRPMGIPSVSYDHTHSISQSLISNGRGFSTVVRLNFLAKEPYRYRQDQRSISVSVASVASSAATTALPNVGSVPVAPVIEIAHRTTSDSAYTITSVTFVIDSKTVKLNSLDFGAKDTNNETRWFIDFDAHAVYRGVRTTAGGSYVQTLRQDVLDSQYYQFGIILPAIDGTAVLSTTYTGSNSPSNTSIKYYEAYY
jgi:hypothetical protein